MIDPNFQDSEQTKRVQKQKMEAMKMIMTEIIDNPSVSQSFELKQVIDYLDKDNDNNVTEE